MRFIPVRKQNGMAGRKKMKQSHSLHRENIAACILVGIAAFLCFFPLWVIVVNSFNSETNVTLNGFSIFPKVLTLDSFKYVLNNKKDIIASCFWCLYCNCRSRNDFYNICNDLLRIYGGSRQADCPVRKHAFVYCMVCNGLQRRRNPMVYPHNTILWAEKQPVCAVCAICDQCF